MYPIYEVYWASSKDNLSDKDKNNRLIRWYIIKNMKELYILIKFFLLFILNVIILTLSLNVLINKIKKTKIFILYNNKHIIYV